MFLQPNEQLQIIQKGAEMIVDEKELLAKLQRSFDTQKPLTIKLGLDPSAPDIHLGHAVVLRKIKQMQELGHRVVIIIGDFTGRIGDPTGKSKGRVALSDDVVKANAQTYCEQIFKVLDEKKTLVRFNSEWLAKLSFEEVIKLAATTSVAQILARDDFQKRYNNQIPIGIHEFFYPLMQAQDSVEIEADIELGGTDQTFNILMGRTLQKHVGQEKQIAIFMPLLEGLDGVEKMSKSLNNYIGINESPEIMFKKVMEVPDPLIVKYFELATDVHPNDLKGIVERLEAGVNPRDIKLELAAIITQQYHGEEEGHGAQRFFETAFQKRQIPDNVPTLASDGNASLMTLVPALIDIGLIKSKSEFMRLIKQDGVSVNGEKIDMNKFEQELENEDVLQIGKKRFLKILK